MTRVALVGAGHSHLHVVSEAARFRRAGVELTLITPGDAWYSGLATGMLAGRDAIEDDVVDVAALCARHGVRLVRDRVVGLDRGTGVLRLASAGGDPIEAEAASFNVGSEVATAGIDGADRAWTVKPIEGLGRLRAELERRLAAGERLAAAVVGGGATGCEVACSLHELARRTADGDAAAERRLDVTLVARGERLLAEGPTGASRALRRALDERGVAVRHGSVSACSEDGLVLEDGQRLEADVVLLATGLRPPRGLAALGLPLGRDGGILVDETLRCPDDDRVFAVGDCADFGPRALPRLGVFGVRQAPVLVDNLLAATHSDGTPRPYEPQRRWLSILNLGRGEGLATWGDAWWRGRTALVLKDWLDRRFLGRFSNSSLGGVDGAPGR